MFIFLFCTFFISCILRVCIVLCIVFPFVHSCLFPIFVQGYRSLPPGGNPIAVNKYHIICHTISYIISFHISYHIISYHMATNRNCGTDFTYLLQHGILKCPSNGVGADTWLRTEGQTSPSRRLMFL